MTGKGLTGSGNGIESETPMVVLKRRSMLVTFRVSAEEHEELAKSCLECGARSIAEFARVAALQKVQMMHAPTGNLSGDLMTISKGLRELDISLADMRKRIRSVLGPTSLVRGRENERSATAREDND